MSTSEHPVATDRLRIVGIAAQACAAVAALVGLVLSAPAFLNPSGAAVVLLLVVGAWCLAGPFLFAAATRVRRSNLELLLVFALVGPGPVLLIAGGYGVALMTGLI